MTHLGAFQPLCDPEALGVHDTEGLWGLAGDFSLLGAKKDRDGFENKLTDILKTRVRPIPTGLDIDTIEIDGKWVCRVTVPAESTPHYLDNELYVRLGNSTEKLTGRDLQDWLTKREGPETPPVDPFTLPWQIMSEADVRAFPEVRGLLDTGWELFMPMERSAVSYWNQGARFVLWQSPGGRGAAPTLPTTRLSMAAWSSCSGRLVTRRIQVTGERRCL